MLQKVTHCAVFVSANAYQLHWSDREMEVAISCIECSRLALSIPQAEAPQI